MRQTGSLESKNVKSLAEQSRIMGWKGSIVANCIKIWLNVVKSLVKQGHGEPWENLSLIQFRSEMVHFIKNENFRQIRVDHKSSRP